MKFKLVLSAAVAAAAVVGAPAQAAVSLTAQPGAAVYAGPTPTYDFEGMTPWNATITTGSLGGVNAQPFGSTGNYGTVGPTEGTPGFLDLSSFNAISVISFIWGSVDSYNTLDVIARDGVTVLASFTGADAAVNPNGNQSDPITNPLAFLQITGADQQNVGGLRFGATQNAFEFDNVAIAVPEPATWAMMIAGFGLVGGAMRRRRSTVQYLTA